MKRVVVTGVGVITPLGNNIDTFWKNILDGVCGIDFISKFDTTDFKVKIAAEVKGFDPTDYMEKSDARRSDPFSQYAMAAAVQAMKDSKLTDINPERLGVYVGSGIGGMQTFIAETLKLAEGGPKKVSPFFIPMMISNMAAGNIAIRFNAQGPCLPIVTACATSSHTIGEAFRSIQHGYADAIIAGGSEATITPLAVAGFTNIMALSTKNIPTQSSLPFDLRRDGFVMGEGAGIIIMEEREHAIKRGAKIYAEVVGYANTCDAYHMTAPHPEAIGATNAIKYIINESNIKNDDSIYINAHGTGTPLNDKTETLAIKQAFQGQTKNVAVSSTKSMTGHMLGAAGGVEAAIAILSLQEQVLPPTIGYQEKDPECDLDYVPNVLRRSKIDYAFSLSLGFGGHNAALSFRRAEEV